MFPKLIATDLDGTLLRADGTVDARTRAALDRVRSAGTEVVLCTARPPRWTAVLARDAGVSGAVVCTNGAVIWDLDAAVERWAFPIACEVAREVVSRLRPLVPGGDFAVEGIDRFAHEPAYVPRWPVGDDVVVDAIEVLLAQPPVKLLLRGPRASPDELARTARTVVGELVEVTHSSDGEALIEMSAVGVDKGSGLAALCAARGIAAEQVLAFGDMPNDLTMLRWAGRGVAVANAHPEVLAGADEVTVSNEENGVAVVLEALLARELR